MHLPVDMDSYKIMTFLPLNLKSHQVRLLLIPNGKKRTANDATCSCPCMSSTFLHLELFCASLHSHIYTFLISLTNNVYMLTMCLNIPLTHTLYALCTYYSTYTTCSANSHCIDQGKMTSDMSRQSIFGGIQGKVHPMS